MENRIKHFSLPSKLVVIWLSIALIWQVGCAPSTYQIPPPLSENIRAKLGTVGIVSARFLPKAEFQIPMGKGSATAHGALEGFLTPFQGGGSAGGGDYGGGAIVILALLPIFTVGGTVIGAVKGVPEEKRKEAETALTNAIAELKIQETMRNHVLNTAKEQTRHSIFIIEDQDPDAPDKEVNYRFLANKGIDTVLEITVPAFGLVGMKEINPPLNFFMTMHTKLVSTSNNVVLYERDFIYRSGYRKFTEWAANNAQPFVESFEHAYQSLAEKIVEEIFLVYDLPLNPAPDSGN